MKPIILTASQYLTVIQALPNPILYIKVAPESPTYKISIVDEGAMRVKVWTNQNATQPPLLGPIKDIVFVLNRRSNLIPVWEPQTPIVIKAFNGETI